MGYSTTIQALERSFAILRAIASHSRSVGVSEVSRITGLPKSTVSRTLAALEEQGAVDRLDDQGHYAIGEGLVELTARATPLRRLRELARGELPDLTEVLGESCAIAIPDNDEVLYVETFAPESVVQVQDWTGARFPFHVVAAGLAIQSTWRANDVRDYVVRGLATFTDRSISDGAELSERLNEARRHGHTWTIQEFSDEINGVAAPILGADGRAVAALTAYGPEFRFPGDDNIASIAAAVSAAAQRITEQLA
jgi:DNA-binding IclR family transcriptional regulator